MLIGFLCARSGRGPRFATIQKYAANVDEEKFVVIRLADGTEQLVSVDELSLATTTDFKKVKRFEEGTHAMELSFSRVGRDDEMEPELSDEDPLKSESAIEEETDDELVEEMES